MDYELLLPIKQPKKIDDDMISATLRLPEDADARRLGRDIKVDLEANKDDKHHRIGGFVLGSVAAFVANLPNVVEIIARHVDEEAVAAAEEGLEDAAAPEVLSGVEVFFGRKRVPKEENLERMRELLYKDMTIDQIRDIHDKPDTRDVYDVKVEVPWDDDHIRLFRFRDGECVEVAAS